MYTHLSPFSNWSSFSLWYDIGAVLQREGKGGGGSQLTTWIQVGQVGPTWPIHPNNQVATQTAGMQQGNRAALQSQTGNSYEIKPQSALAAEIGFSDMGFRI